MQTGKIKSFEVYIDIHNAGSKRTLTIVPQENTFSVLLNGVNIAQLEYIGQDFEDWRLRFGNLSAQDVDKIGTAIRQYYRRS